MHALLRHDRGDQGGGRDVESRVPAAKTRSELAPSRSSIGISAPVGVARSIVEVGATM
jgi:hypothetical protein